MMPILGTCPNCGTNAPLETYLLDREAREAFAALCQRLADHPEVLKRVPAYLALHSRPGRSTAWPKVTRLVRELADLVTSQAVTHSGQARVNHAGLWALAMDEAQDARAAGTLSVPLGGHGWLRKVAWTKAGQQEAREQAARLAEARGETPIGYSQAHRIQGQATQETPDGATLRELVGELAALQRLEKASPGTHADAIAALQLRLAALRPSTPTATDHP